jgi:curved DNA-binding protein CbpA
VDDYYEILGIAHEADDAELRRVWRQLAKKWHPDHAGTDTTFIFQKLLAAYETLVDPARRAAYDRQLRASAPRPHDAAPQPAVRKRAPGVLLTRISGVLPILIGRGVVREVAPGEYDILLDAEETATGGMITIAMDVATRDEASARFSAWLAVPPDFADGIEVRPSTLLPDMLAVPRFRLRR